jgi:putative ABC transport system permease protein
VERILQEIKYAFRQFRESPGFSVTAVLMLALGIAAATATFSVVEGVLLRPLPFREPGRLVALGDIVEGTGLGNGSGPPVTGPEIRTYAREMHTLESLGGYQPAASYELSGAGVPSQVNATRLSAGVFPTLGLSPVMGRVFTQREDEDSEQVAVLSYSLWQSRLHGDPNVVGAKILLDRKPYIVVGVMPRNFEFPLMPGHLNRSELWVPMSLTTSELTQSGSWGFQIVGRLKPGVTVAQARADADQVALEIERSFPSFIANIKIRAVVRPLQEDTVADARPLIRILFLAVCVVLLIACANLAGLLLVRAIRRRREISVRLALGASTAALLRQNMLESLALSVTGGVLGIALAAIAIRVCVSQLPETLPRISEIGLDWMVVAFALFLALMTGILCSLAPAFAAIRTDLNESLKEGGRGGSAGGGHARLRSTLVVLEIAIALVLVAASGLLLRSFEKMREVAIGFQPEHVLIASYSLPRQQYDSQSAVNGFNDEVLRRLRELPGTEFAGLTTAVPMSGSNGITVFVPEGYVAPQGANMSLATVTLTAGNYFAAMKIPLLRGRVFTEADKDGAPLVVMTNHKLAEHYWPGQDPIGKRLRLGTADVKSPWLTIVGEVADVKQDSPDVETREQYYEPVEQYETSSGQFGQPSDVWGNSGYITVRTTLPPEQMENALRSTVRSLDPQLALAQIQTMEHAVSDSEAPRRFNTAVIAAFAGGAVLLAVLGIYSVIAFSVELRVREIAIRMALGSQRKGIVRLILRSALRLAAIGCVAGVLGALAVSRLMGSLLFQVNPFDPLVLGLAGIAILFLVLTASVLPAIQAASINPTKALRAE